jgi:hypothetical protein
MGSRDPYPEPDSQLQVNCYFDPKKIQKLFQLYFSLVFGHQNLGSGLDPGYPNSLETLDPPYPDPDSMNPDPQPWLKWKRLGKSDGRVCSGDAGAEEHGVPAGRERRGIQLSPHTRATQQLST